VSFATLLDHLSIDKLLKVFAALLLERKLIFCSRHLRYSGQCFVIVLFFYYVDFFSILHGWNYNNWNWCNVCVLYYSAIEYYRIKFITL